MSKQSKEYILLFFILILSFFVRIYNLHKQSITFDEFIFLSNTNIFDFSTYLSAFFANHPDYSLSPLTPTIIYIFSNLLHHSIPALRLIPIFFGLGSIVIVYAMGKKIGGMETGLLASLFFCFSPMNIWVHQEIKCYSFCLFFSLLSFYSILNFIYEEKKYKWLIIGLLSNLILPWLHATYIFVPAIQIVIIFFFIRVIRFRFFVLWSFQSFLSCITWSIWFFNQKTFLYTSNEPYKVNSNIQDIFISLFCNDSVGLSKDLLPEWKTNNLSIIHCSFWKFVLPYWYMFDYLLAYSLIIFVLFFIVTYIFNFIKNKNGKESFLFYILIVPIFLFLCLQIITKNSFLTIQYIMYTLPIYYLCVSFLIYKIKYKHIKFLFIILFLSCFLSQSLSLICFKNRTDYKGAFEYLKKEIPLNGILLGQRFSSIYDVGKLYLQRDDIEFIPILSLNSFIDKSYKILFSESNINNFVYLLMEPVSIQSFRIENPESLLSDYFEKNNMKVNWLLFPGQYNLYVGKVTKNHKNTPINENVYMPTTLNSILYESLLTEFKLDTQDITERNRRLKVLRNIFFVYPHFPAFYILIISNMIYDNELEVANNICLKLIQEYPNFASLYLLEGIILHKEGQFDKAKLYIEKAYQISNNLYLFYGDIINVLINKKDNFFTTCQFVNKFEKYGFVLFDKALLSFCEN